MTEILKRNTLLDACINNNGNIFDIIQRQTTPSVPGMIDGISVDTEMHFAKLYGELYDSVKDRDRLISVKQFLSKFVDPSSLKDIVKITPALIKEAISRIKNNKSDPVFDFTSNCLKNAPSILFNQLSSLFRYYLIHGHTSELLMKSTLIPIPKDKLGDACSGENYRPIAISSMILKIFDWVVLLLFEELRTDELQFGFQQKTSANMCTWLVAETIDYFQRNGSEVYACVMDLSKAFDRIKHSALFWKLPKKGMPPVYVRLLLVTYEKQKANVRWNNVLSETFSVNNGVKQGALLSPILFCVYIDCLFSVLRRNRTGCWINGMYAGIMWYADDMWLLSPTQDGLQEMVQIVVITVKVSIYRLVPIRIQEGVKQSVLLIQRKRKPCERLCLVGVNYHQSCKTFGAQD